jgi:hypothetical protein
MKQPEGLIGILLDRTARIDERDDAAMDLGGYDDERALAALIVIAASPSEPETLQSSAGTAIGEIWARTAVFDQAVFAQLTPIAQTELRGAMGD